MVCDKVKICSRQYIIIKDRVYYMLSIVVMGAMGVYREIRTVVIKNWYINNNV